MSLTPPKLGNCNQETVNLAPVHVRNQADRVPDRPQSFKPSTTPPRKQIGPGDATQPFRRVTGNAAAEPMAQPRAATGEALQRPVCFPQRPSPLMERYPRRSTIRNHRKVINPLIDLAEDRSLIRNSLDSNIAASIISYRDGDSLASSNGSPVIRVHGIEELATQRFETGGDVGELLGSEDTEPIVEMLRSARRQQLRRRRHSVTLEVRLELEPQPPIAASMESLVIELSASANGRVTRADVAALDIWHNGPPRRRGRRSLGEDDLHQDERARTALRSVTGSERELLEFMLALRPIVAPGVRLVHFLEHVDVHKVKSLLPLRAAFEGTGALSIPQRERREHVSIQDNCPGTCSAAFDKSALLRAPTFWELITMLERGPSPRDHTAPNLDSHVRRVLIEMLGGVSTLAWTETLRTGLGQPRFIAAALSPGAKLTRFNVLPHLDILYDVAATAECNSEPGRTDCLKTATFLAARRCFYRRSQENSVLQMEGWQQLALAWFAAAAKALRPDKTQRLSALQSQGYFPVLYAKAYGLLLDSRRSVWKRLVTAFPSASEASPLWAAQHAQVELTRPFPGQRRYLKVANGTDYCVWLEADTEHLAETQASNGPPKDLSPLSRCHRWSLEPQKLTVNPATMTNLRRSSMWTSHVSPRSATKPICSKPPIVAPSLDELMRMPFTPVGRPPDGVEAEVASLERETPLPSKK